MSWTCRSERLALLAVASLAVSPVAAAPVGTIWVPVCGNHAPLPLPIHRKGEMPQGCHAACVAGPEKRKRLASG